VAAEPAPFPAAWFETVFLVAEPPREWPETFAVVTAHNPAGLPAEHDVNAERERELAQRLGAAGIAFFEVVGASPDLLHREAGFGFAAEDPGEAAEIATEFGQQGFFWIEGGDVYICVDASGRGWRVGAWLERLRR
jgi:hypothetical protein